MAKGCKASQKQVKELKKLLKNRPQKCEAMGTSKARLYKNIAQALNIGVGNVNGLVQAINGQIVVESNTIRLVA